MAPREKKAPAPAPEPAKERPRYPAVTPAALNPPSGLTPCLVCGTLGMRGQRCPVDGSEVA